MITSTIDLGQIIIALCCGVIGFFIKREIGNISTKIQYHDTAIVHLSTQVAELIGAMKIYGVYYDGKKRRLIDDE